MRVKTDQAEIYKLGISILLPGLEMAARVIADQIAQIKISVAEPEATQAQPSVVVAKEVKPQKRYTSPEVKERMRKASRAWWDALTPRQQRIRINKMNRKRLKRI